MGHIYVRILLTDVEEAVAGTIPLPALQLLVLRVLQPAVMEHHSHDALQTDARIWCQNQSCGPEKKPNLCSPAGLQLRGVSHLHHLVVELGELPLLPVVQHPDLVRLA